MQSKLLMAFYLGMALLAMFNAYITSQAVRSTSKERGSGRGWLQYLWAWLVLCGLVFVVLAFK